MNFDPLDPGFDFVGIFSVFFVGLAVFLGVYGFRALILGQWSVRWPTAAGRITDAWTEWRSGYRGTRYRSRTRRAKALLEPGIPRATWWCFFLSALFFGIANLFYRVHR